MLKDYVKAQINHIETEYVPYTLWIDSFAEEKINLHYGNDSWKKRINNSIVNVGTFDSWCTMVSTGTDEGYDAYGSSWSNTSTLHHLDKPALQDIKYEDYKLPTIDAFIDNDKRKMIMSQLSENKDKYLIGNIGGGPFELSWRIMGVEEALMASAIDEQLYKAIVDDLALLIHQFIDELIKLPVDAIMLFDDWCDQRGIIIGAEKWRMYFKEHMESFHKKIHDAGKKTILHVCGSVEEIIPDLIETGLDVLESIQPEANNMDPYKLKRKYGEKLSFWGGIGCQELIVFEKPRDITKEVRNMRKNMSIDGGYILSLSKDINKSVPIENALAIIDAFTELDYMIS